MRRGTHFLGMGLRLADGTPRAIEGRYRAKVIGNGLRELDRFLNHLAQALAATLGIRLASDERNTANKVARLRAALGRVDSDHARLAALGRSRDCLFHCGGQVRRGDRPGDTVLTIGWPTAGGQALRRVAVGEELRVSEGDLLEVCLYYRDIADRLLAEADVAPGPVPPGAGFRTNIPTAGDLGDAGRIRAGRLAGGGAIAHR